MGKAEISWKRRTEEGVKREVYAQHVGNRWIFHVRGKRFDQWQDLPEPPLEDWKELLDAVHRRVNRKLLPPVEEERVIKTIKERFPEADV